MTERFSASSSIEGPQHQPYYEQYLPNLEPVVHFVRAVRRCEPNEFSGRPNTIIVQDWVGVMGDIFELCQVPHVIRTSIATTYLRQTAREWWNEQLMEPQEVRWLDFCVAISDAFNNQTRLQRFYETTQMWMQYDGETIAEYTTRFQDRVVNTCPYAISDEELKFYYWNGLRFYFRQNLNYRAYVSINDMVDAVRHAEIRIARHYRDDYDEQQPIRVFFGNIMGIDEPVAHADEREDQYVDLGPNLEPVVLPDA